MESHLERWRCLIDEVLIEGVMVPRFGCVTCPTPALVDGSTREAPQAAMRRSRTLVDAATWEAAQAVMLRSRNLVKQNAQRDYPLHGLIRCDNRGRFDVGTCFANRPRYRCCGGTWTRPGPDGQAERYLPKHRSADWLEAVVWEGCGQFILNPGNALDEARRTRRERMSESTSFDAERRAGPLVGVLNPRANVPDIVSLERPLHG